MKRILTLTMALFFGVAVLSSGARSDELSEPEECINKLQASSAYVSRARDALNTPGDTTAAQCRVAVRLLRHLDGMNLSQNHHSESQVTKA